MLLPVAPNASLDDGPATFLLLNADITLVRQVEGVGRFTRADVPPAFGLQGLAATPKGGRSIDLTQTRAAIARLLLSRAATSGWHEKEDTLFALQERLRIGQPHILHLICHGEQQDTGRGVRSDLLFTHRHGYIQRVNAFDLTPLLALAPDLQVVVLQACHSGAVDAVPTSSEQESERRTIESIALALIGQGVPTVIAMQGEVGQEAAGEFVQTFYAMLDEGHGVEHAVAIGRVAMRRVGGMIDWSLPVVYQGSGQIEPSTWYTRAADRIDVMLNDRRALRTLRGILVIWALVLLTVAFLRRILFPPSSSPALDLLAWPLLVWVGLGIIGPAIIAVTHRELRYRSDIQPPLRRAVRRAQWMGAYLGYAVGGILGLAVLASIGAAGGMLLPPGWLYICFGLVIGGALMFSYATARSQARSALASARLYPDLYNRRTTAILIIGMSILLAAPLLLVFSDLRPVLLHPMTGAIALAVILFSSVIWQE